MKHPPPVSQPLQPSSMTSMQLAQDSSGQTGTAYAGVFAASPNTDLAFFLHDATDGVSNGVDVLSISTGGCGSASVPCLNADGTCSCLPSSLFSSVSPVSKCNDVSLNNQTVPFTLGYCIANPPPFIPSPPPQVRWPQLRFATFCIQESSQDQEKNSLSSPKTGVEERSG